ncbi:MAG: T9SS type A sorting domain-containing protein [Candidatus Marinimicrobia bacterium]|nr:T9SS type A sorting domain-containing protein [Candidatus Neomarinimicrobiota bacterium]
MAGKKIETLLNKTKSPGYHKIKWQASGLPSGVYFYRIQSENFSEVKKCILVK